MKRYSVKEIFGPTLQGEATYTGQAAVFIRFSGCNRWTGKEKDRDKATCTFCDTDFDGGVLMTAQEIIDKVHAVRGKVYHVVLSGGEPTLQIDRELLEALCRESFILHLETNGSRDIGRMRELFFHITCSPKQPPAETHLPFAHDLKILYPTQIPGTEPYLWNNFSCDQKWIQPVDSAEKELNQAHAVRFVLENPSWRLSLQTHKILGVK